MIEINCQSSIKISEDKIIYFDPIKQDQLHDADYIFITHPHWNHFSKEDIFKVKKDTTKIIGPKDIEKACLDFGFSKDNIVILKPNQNILIDNIVINTFPSYNINKAFHPRENEWLGYLVDFNKHKYYIPGDTDVIDEISNLKVDLCFIPIGGTYTMNVTEAIEYIDYLKPTIAIPIHYGMITGSPELAEEFKNNVNKEIDVQIKINN